MEEREQNQSEQLAQHHYHTSGTHTHHTEGVHHHHSSGSHHHHHHRHRQSFTERLKSNFKTPARRRKFYSNVLFTLLCLVAVVIILFVAWSYTTGE